MNRLDGLLTHHPLPTWRFAAWPIIALTATLLVWANFARLDQVAVATAEVVPQGKVKVIQHLEGGIIEHIYVGEGSAVHAGDPLVRLDLATSGVNRKELLARLDSALLHRARLLGESSGAVLALPTDGGCPAAERRGRRAASLRGAHPRAGIELGRPQGTGAPAGAGGPGAGGEAQVGYQQSGACQRASEDVGIAVAGRPDRSHGASAAAGRSREPRGRAAGARPGSAASAGGRRRSGAKIERERRALQAGSPRRPGRDRAEHRARAGVVGAGDRPGSPRRDQEPHRRRRQEAAVTTPSAVSWLRARRSWISYRPARSWSSPPSSAPSTAAM